MCGIAGYVGAGSPELLARMIGRLAHRGPDDSGSHTAPGAGLGMTRLSIIDLTTGQQPMTNEDGTAWIVFNGEIYNYRALRGELETRGHRFETSSDTEVILHAWEEFGEACVERLRGMFAFAIWDTPRHVLFLARDRLGKKPLHYWHADGRFLFASEPKALLIDPAVGREVDWGAFHHYLAFGYTPTDRTMFAGIAKLPPAHTATLRGGTLRLQRYWSPPAGTTGRPISADEAAERARAALRDAVRTRLESEVPLGVFLSGGIDSSAVVASMREVTGGRIATFSIGFGRDARSFDELPYARLVARRFETDHHEEILDPKVEAVLPAVVGAFDEPFADSSAIPTFLVAEATARHVKVVLSGIGGDETFAGYPRYLGVRLSEHYGRVPGALRAVIAGAVGRLGSRETSRDWADRARRFVAGAREPMPGRYIGWTRFFSERDLDVLLTPAVRGHAREDVERAGRAAFAARAPEDVLDGAIRIDLATYLPEDLLVMADRMSMAHSLELRAPFCDHRLVEEGLAIPSGVKLPGLRLKGLLKRAFADTLPSEVLARPKQGFMVPLGRWLRGQLRPLMETLLAPDRVRARGVFAPAGVERLVREHLDGRRSHADRLWALMMFEVWVQQYLDGRGLWTAS